MHIPSIMCSLGKGVRARGIFRGNGVRVRGKGIRGKGSGLIWAFFHFSELSTALMFFFTSCYSRLSWAFLTSCSPVVACGYIVLFGHCVVQLSSKSKLVALEASISCHWITDTVLDCSEHN